MTKHIDFGAATNAVAVLRRHRSDIARLARCGEADLIFCAELMPGLARELGQPASRQCYTESFRDLALLEHRLDVREKASEALSDCKTRALVRALAKVKEARASFAEEAEDVCLLADAAEDDACSDALGRALRRVIDARADTVSDAAEELVAALDQAAWLMLRNAGRTDIPAVSPAGLTDLRWLAASGFGKALFDEDAGFVAAASALGRILRRTEAASERMPDFSSAAFIAGAARIASAAKKGEEKRTPEEARAVELIGRLRGLSRLFIGIFPKDGRTAVECARMAAHFIEDGRAFCREVSAFAGMKR